MISYDKYQNRIKKIAAVKNFIVRFRWPFIALFTILLAGSLALMFTKGMITQDLVLPEGVVYGDNYKSEIKAPKAFLSDVKYQFKRVQEENDTKSAVKYSLTDSATVEYEWTYDLPTFAGKYLVRTVTNKITGKSYSSPKEFEIATKPIEFVIISDSVYYGEMPASYEFNTVSGDRLDKDSVRFVYEHPAESSSKVKAIESSFRIYNSDGEDVTFCYDITAPIKEEEVTIKPTNATLAPASLITEYIGAEIDYKNSVYHWKGGDVKFTTKIKYNKTGEYINPVNAGSYTVEINRDSIQILTTDIEGNTVDVTHQYNLSVITSTITVNRRPVTVTTESKTKEYDGTPLEHTSIQVDNLVPGHKYDVDYFEDRVEAGTYLNTCNFTIYDNDGDVTENYVISYKSGTFEIKRRKISLKTESYSKVYDGTAYFNLNENSYKITKDAGVALVSGHTEMAYYNLYYSDVGTYENNISIRIFEGGIEKTSNYEILNSFGTLTIEQREIQVTSASTTDNEWTYDGTKQTKKEIANIVLLSEIEGVKEPLAEGEVISVSNATEVVFYTETAVANVIECVIRNNNGYGSLTTHNYNIKYVKGTLKMNKRSLTITTPDDDKPYDGTPLLGTRKKAYGDNLAWCDRLDEATTVASRTYLGRTENVTEFNIVSDYWGRSTTDNYEIDYDYGWLEIRRHSLTVTTAQVTKTYDGTPLWGSDEEYGKPSFSFLADGDYYKAYETVSRTDSGFTQNTTKYKIYTDREGTTQEVTANYGDTEGNITYDNRIITITPRTVKITVETVAHEYDGQKFECHDFTYEPLDTVRKSGLLTNLKHKVELDPDNEGNYAFVVNVGDGRVKNEFKVIFKDENGKDISDNYLPDYNYGDIYVVARTILVTTGSETWVYDAQAHFNTQIVDLKHGKGTSKDDFVEDKEDTATFVSGNILTLTAHEVTEAGNHPNKCGYTISGDNDPSNYKLLWDLGTLTILPRPITIMTGTATKEYDGTALECREFTPEDPSKDRGLLSSIHNAELDDENNTYVSITDVGEVKNVFAVIIIDKTSGKDVSKNYNIEYTYKFIYRTPREITIKTATSSKEFDGTPYSDPETNPDIVIKKGSLVSGHKLSALAGFSTVTFVGEGEVPNIVEYTVTGIDGGTLTEFGNPISGNYKISYDMYGTISRTVRHVLVTTNSNSWTYDGEKHSDTGYTSVHLKDGKPDDEVGLVLGHSLEVDDSLERYITYVINFTEEEVENFVAYRFADNTVKENYSLSFEYGTLSIKKRRIIIETASAVKVYDGDPLSCTDNWTVYGYDEDDNKLESGLYKEGGLYKEHTLQVLEYASMTDVKWANDEYLSYVLDISNEVTYKVVVKEGNEEVDGNYEIIEYHYGTLRVNPRAINVETEGKSKTYDGTKLVWAKFSYESENGIRGLLDNENHRHKIMLDSSKPVAEITYITMDEDGNLVRSVKNKLYYVILEGTQPKTNNYYIIDKCGMLTIEEAPLTVTTNSNSWKYNGEYHSDTTATFDTLISGEIWEAIDETITKVIDYREGGYQNTTEFRTFTPNGKTETTYCYDINYVYGTLEIERINLEITTLSRTKIYDGNPLMGDDTTYTVGDESYIAPVFSGLAKNDYPLPIEGSVTSITDFGSIENETQYDIFADREGDEVKTTGNYILVSYTKGTLAIEKRTIWIETGSDSKQYDGEPLVCLEAEVVGLGLVKDHKLKVVEYDDTYVDVRRDGEEVTGVENKLTVIVVYNDGKDTLNENYTIEGYTYGKLTVYPRVILVTTDDGMWIYDGKPHYQHTEKAVHGSGTNEDNFVADKEDTVTFVLNHSLVGTDYADTTNKGTTPNESKYDVKDGNGESVISNYNLIVVFGTLEILSRPVTVTTGSATKEYDGTPLTCEEAEFEDVTSTNSGPIEGHKVIAVEGQQFKSITDVSESGAENEFYVKILDENDNVVSENYIIVRQFGTLTITARNVRIVTKSTEDGEWTYDGKEHSKSELNRELIKHGKIDENGNFIPDDDDPFVLDHDYSLFFEYKVIDAGTYDNECEYTVLDGNGESVLSNYNLIVVAGKLVIEKRLLTITTATLEKIYDGTPLMGNDDSGVYGLPAEILGLAEGDEAVASYIVKLTDCDSVTNDTRYDIYRNGKDDPITDNYDISYTKDGTLTVTECIVWVVSGTGEKEYNGIAQSYVDYCLITNGAKLADGHALEPVTPTWLTFVERDENGDLVRHPNIVTYKVVDRKGDDAVSGNYKIEYLNADGEEEYGTFTITPRKIVINTRSKDKEYDGTPLTNYEDAWADRLLENLGHYLVPEDMENLPSATNVSDVVENAIKFLIYDENGDVSANYDISYGVYGWLTITPRKITIELDKIEDMVYGDKYEGYLASEAEYTYAKDSNKTVGGDELIITVKFTFNGKDIEIDRSTRLNAGIYTVVIDGIDISEGGDINNYNVEISTYSSTFEVKRRPITIILIAPDGKVYDSEKFVFNGSPYVLEDGDSYTGYEITAGKIAYDDETLTIKVQYYLNGELVDDVLDAGEYTILFYEEGCIIDVEEGEAYYASTNYEITCAESVTYKIDPKPVKFIISNATYEYRGEAYEINDNKLISLDKEFATVAKNDTFVYARGSAVDEDGGIFDAINVGTYDFGIKRFVIIRNNTGATVSYNYCISEEQTYSTLTITERYITLSFAFGNTNLPAHDFTGEEIDLYGEYPEYGPYTTAPDHSGIGDWGIHTDDLEKIEAVFTVTTTDGAAATLKDVGKYIISVELIDTGDGSTLSNYIIAYPDPIEYEITYRRITVTPKMTGGALVYNGKPLDKSYLDYETKHYFSDESGFLYDTDRDDYEVTYFLYLEGDESTNLLEEILQAGTYYLKITLVYKGEGEEHYYFHEIYDSETFTVQKRRLFIATPDDPNEYVYNKKAVNTVPADEACTAYYLDGTWNKDSVNRGFVNDDGEGVTYVYKFYKDNTAYNSVVDAGTYQIRVVGFKGGDTAYINRNYEFTTNVTQNSYMKFGTLTIKPAILVVVPVAYSIDFDGSVEIIRFPATGYSRILYVQDADNPNRTVLFGSDKLTYTVNGSVNIRQTYMIRVSFSSIKISDGDRNVNSNYDIVYTYSKLTSKYSTVEKRPESLKKLNSLSFSVELSFNRIKLTVNQPELPEKYNAYKVVTFGSVTTIPLAGTDITDRVQTPSDLLAGHTVVIGSAMIVASQAEYVEQWLQMCKVYDRDGKEITMGYDITIYCAETTYIKVLKSNLVITVKIDVNGLADGYKLSSGEYSVSGSLYFGGTLSVTVKDNQCVATITCIDSVDENGNYVYADHTDGYDITIKYAVTGNNEKEAEYASRIQLLLSRRVETVGKNDISE